MDEPRPNHLLKPTFQQILIVDNETGDHIHTIEGDSLPVPQSGETISFGESDVFDDQQAHSGTHQVITRSFHYQKFSAEVDYDRDLSLEEETLLTLVILVVEPL